MSLFATPKFRILSLLVLALCISGLLLFILGNNRAVTPAAPPADYSLQLKGKQWDTTITGQFTVQDIDSREMIPILILDLTVKNNLAKEILLNCVLAQSNDNGKTVQDVYYPFWALNIKPQDDLRLVKIPPQGTLSGKIAFELQRTAEVLWLKCGSDIQVQVQ